MKKRSANQEKYEAYERAEFDKATHFTASIFYGRGTRVTVEFPSPREAIAHAEGKSNVAVYAVAPYSSIHLSPGRYDEWITRWENNQRAKAMIEVTSPETSTFLLHWNGRGPGSCEVLRFASKATAEAYTFESLPGDRIAYVVESVEDILSDRVRFNLNVLADLVNAFSGAAPIKKVSDRNAGANRVMKLLQQKYASLPLTAITEASSTDEGEEAVATKTTTKRKGQKRAKKEAAQVNGSGRRGRVAMFADDAVVTVLVEENPRRKGTASFERFTHYRSGATVKQTIEAGVWREDMRWDVSQKFISVK